MSVSNLSSDARRRLWQCYSLLLQLADEAEQLERQDSEKQPANQIATETPLDPHNKETDTKQ